MTSLLPLHVWLATLDPALPYLDVYYSFDPLQETVLPKIRLGGMFTVPLEIWQLIQRLLWDIVPAFGTGTMYIDLHTKRLSGPGFECDLPVSVSAESDDRSYPRPVPPHTPGRTW